jgi:hypothetical protein
MLAMINLEARTAQSDLSEAQRIQTQGPIADNIIADLVGKIFAHPRMENNLGSATEGNRERFREGTMTDRGPSRLVLPISNGRIVFSHGIQITSIPGGSHVRDTLFLSRTQREKEHEGPVLSASAEVVSEYDVIGADKTYTRATWKAQASHIKETPDADQPFLKQVEKLCPNLYS